MISAIFINTSVENFARSREFFQTLGFTFDPKFTGDNAGCLVLSENINVMLVEKDRFKNFIDQPIADRGTTEAILSLQCSSAEEVRRLAEKAFSLGARKVNDIDDNEAMLSWGFEDLDGHLWDLFCFKAN